MFFCFLSRFLLCPLSLFLPCSVVFYLCVLVSGSGLEAICDGTGWGLTISYTGLHLGTLFSWQACFVFLCAGTPGFGEAQVRSLCTAGLLSPTKEGLKLGRAFSVPPVVCYPPCFLAVSFSAGLSGLSHLFDIHFRTFYGCPSSVAIPPYIPIVL